MTLSSRWRRMPDVTRESGVSVGYSTVLDKSLFEAQREERSSCA
jgi:hypothetical protein